MSLPVWIPGSYLVREFSKNLQGLQAHQGSRSRCRCVTQLDKCSWQIACAPGQPLVLRYEVYAYDNSVRTAWLDANAGLLQRHQPVPAGRRPGGRCRTRWNCPPPRPCAGWQVATGLTPQKIDSQGFGRYLAADYDELVDCPVEMGAFWSGSFNARRRAAPLCRGRRARASFDGARLLADTQKICETEIRFWHGSQDKPPHQANYLFMLNAVDDGYGGLEHRNSTALICTRKDLPRLGERQRTSPTATPRCCGLISHEYFHTWNVKRLRPAEFDTLRLRPARTTPSCCGSLKASPATTTTCCCAAPACWTTPATCKLLTKTINQVLQTPGPAGAVGGRRPASTPGSSTTGRTKTRPTPPSATTPRARWWRCAWT